MEKSFVLNSINILGIDICDGIIWFTLQDFNGLCKMTTDLSDVEYVVDIPQVNNVSNICYSMVAACGDKIVLISNQANQILIYDSMTHKYTSVTIRDTPKGNKFVSYIYRDNKVYLIPGQYSAIVCINLKTNIVNYVDSWLREFPSGIKEGKVYFRPQIADVGNGIFYLVSKHYNCVCIFDTNTEKVEVINNKNGKMDDGASCVMEYKGGVILVYTNISTIEYYKKDIKKEMIADYKLLSDGIIDFSRIVVADDVVFCVPFQADRVVCLKVSEELIEDVGGRRFEKSPRYRFAWKHEDNVCCLRDSEIDFYSFDGMYIKTEKVYGNELFWHRLVSNHCRDNSYIYEGKHISLETYLMSV